MYSLITYEDSNGETHTFNSKDLKKTERIEAHADGKIINKTRFDIKKIVSVETIEDEE